MRYVVVEVVIVVVVVVVLLVSTVLFFLVMHDCVSCSIRLVMILCTAHADSSLVDEQGWTPLHYAAYAGNTDICGYLLSQVSCTFRFHFAGRS